MKRQLALVLTLLGCTTSAPTATDAFALDRDASAFDDAAVSVDGFAPDAAASDTAVDTAVADTAVADTAVDASPTDDASAHDGDASTPPAERIWEPGHYLIVNTAESGDGDRTAEAVVSLLDQADARRFTGVHVKFLLRTFEPTEGAYDFSVLDGVLDAAAARTCTAGDGSSAPCRVVIQFQYKTPDPRVPPIPDYMLGGGLYCGLAGSTCGIPDDPAARTAAQRSYCSTVDESRCGVHEFVPSDVGAGGESLAMLWLPGIEGRFQAMFAATVAHLAARADGSTVTALAFPETTFEWDPDTLAAEGYSRDLYEAAIRRNMQFARVTDPTRVTFQYVGNLPPILRAMGLDDWTDMVTGFYDFTAAEEGLGIGHPDVAPLLGPVDRTTGFTVNPAVVLMMDPDYFGSVPRNPNVQSPDIQSDRTESFESSYDLVVNRVRGNYVTWTTSERGTPVFTWRTVADYIATNPLPAANRARPSW